MNCGTEIGYTLNENLVSFKKFKIQQRILTDVSNINTKKKNVRLMFRVHSYSHLQINM